MENGDSNMTLRQQHINELNELAFKIYSLREEEEKIIKRMDECKSIIATIDFLENQEKSKTET